MKQTFKRCERIKKNKEFDMIFKKGRKIKMDKVVFFILDNNLAYSRIGIVFSKEIKKVVTRNGLKRLARDVFRKNKDKLYKHRDIVILFKDIVKYKELEDIFCKMVK